MTEPAMKPKFSIVGDAQGEAGETLPNSDMQKDVADVLKKAGVSAHPAVDELQHQLERAKALGVEINRSKGGLNQAKDNLKAFDEDVAKQRAVLVENIDAQVDNLTGLVETKKVVSETVVRLEALVKAPPKTPAKPARGKRK